MYIGFNEGIENKEDRKVVEIIGELDREYAYGVGQLHYNLGQILIIIMIIFSNY